MGVVDTTSFAKVHRAAFCAVPTAAGGVRATGRILVERRSVRLFHDATEVSGRFERLGARGAGSRLAAMTAAGGGRLHVNRSGSKHAGKDEGAVA